MVNPILVKHVDRDLTIALIAHSNRWYSCKLLKTTLFKLTCEYMYIAVNNVYHIQLLYVLSNYSNSH